MSGTWARRSLDGSDDAIMQQLEASIPVRLMGTVPFESCGADERCGDVLARFEEKAFDHIPVRRGGDIVGVFNTKGKFSKEARTAEVMQPLCERYLLSADAPLLNFVERADERPYCLLLDGERLEGIVTLSDLQRLPVRPALFLLVTHLEMLISERLRAEPQSWRSRLTAGTLTKIDRAYNQLRRRNLEVDPVAAMSLNHKLLAASTMEWLGDQPGSEAWSRIQQFRNALAHADDLIEDEESARNVASTVRFIRQLIMQLRREPRRRKI